MAAPAFAQPLTDEPVETTGARALARAAVLDLRLRVDPTPTDARISRLALEAASDAVGGDPEYLRLAIEAAHASGERDEVARLTRELIRLDPTDSVALLRYLTDQASKAQTAEQRLATIERFTTGRADALPASVRSRLALDGALLARELGRVELFGELLKRAVTLDSTNKEAASMAYSTAVASGDLDAAEKLELLSNLLLADPSDPSVMNWIAVELYRVGLYEQARRFHDMSGGILIRAGLDPTNYENKADIIRWAIEGPEPIIEKIDLNLEKLRFNAQRLADRLAETGEAPPEGFVAPEDVAVPVDQEMTRLIAVLPDATTQDISDGLQRLKRSVLAGMDQLISMQRSATDAQRASRLLLEWQRHALMMLRGFAVATAREPQFGQAVQADVNAVVTLVFGGMPDALLASEEISGWDALIKSRPEEAATLFRELVDEDPQIAWPRLGLALALDQIGDTEGSIEQLGEIRERGPLTLPAVIAERLLGDQAPSPDAGVVRRASAIARGVPEAVDEMAQSPGRFMTLRLERQRRQDPLGGGRLTLTLRNIAPFPLGVGPGRPLNSRMLVTGELTAAGQDAEIPTPYVADAARRLRLMPRQELTIPIEPAVAHAGWILARDAARPSRARWRVYQGFQLGRYGYFTAGPLCHETGSPAERVPSITEAALPVDELAAAIRNAEQSDLARIAVATFAAAVGRLDADANALLAEAWAEKYPQLSSTERAAITALLPPPGAAPGFEAFDTETMNESDPLALLAHCITRVTDPEDPRLLRALDSDDTRVADLATLVGLRLSVENPVPGYAAADADLSGLLPPEEPEDDTE